MTVRPTQPTIVGQVVERIREAILMGEFKPGEKIDQDAIAQKLGISRMPVREALIKLAETGFVEIKPHRGAHVAKLSRSKIEEIYLIRTRLETLASRVAATNMSPQVLQELEAILHKADNAIAEGDHERLNELNREFHRTGYKSCNLPRLYTLIEQLRDQSELYRRHHASLTQRTWTALEEHWQILRAWREGNADQAERWTQINLENSAAALLKELPADASDSR